MKKAFKILKIVAIILVASFVIARFPGLVFGSAKVIVKTAQLITGATDTVLASGGK